MEGIEKNNFTWEIMFYKEKTTLQDIATSPRNHRNTTRLFFIIQ